jgi:hypothetical protein
LDSPGIISPLSWVNTSGAFEVIDGKSTIYLGTAAIQDLEIKKDGFFPPESVDFILTDPPYGDSIQYFELSELWNDWLGFPHSPTGEIVINSRQGKNFEQYQCDLEAAFQKCYEMLKPQRFMIVTFHNNSFQIRNALISAVLSAGFELQHATFQIPPRRSLKAYLHPQGTPIGDYYFRFYKGCGKAPPHPIPGENLERVISRIFEQILVNRAEPTLLLWMGNLVDAHFAQEGLFPFPDLVNFEDICSNSPDLTIKGKEIWLKHPSRHSLPPPLSERVKFALEYLLQNRPRPISREDKKNASWGVLREFNGDLTPDPLLLRDLISEIENGR